MRLIDADRLKDKLKTLPMMSNWGEIFMPSLIDEQPTAYDIEEKVEQLEENYSCDVGNLKMISLDKAIEIVKSGERK